MNEEEKMQAAKQMSSQERDTIMAVSARVNNSIDESMNQIQLQQQQLQQNTTSSVTNTTPNALRHSSCSKLNRSKYRSLVPICKFKSFIEDISNISEIQSHNRESYCVLKIDVDGKLSLKNKPSAI